MKYKYLFTNWSPAALVIYYKVQLASSLCTDRGQIESAGKSRQRVGGESPPHGNG